MGRRQQPLIVPGDLPDTTASRSSEPNLQVVASFATTQAKACTLNCGSAFKVLLVRHPLQNFPLTVWGSGYTLFPRLSREADTLARARTDLMQGTLELLILKTLSRDAMHGYGIAQRIHQAAEDLLKIEDGSLYPALYRMEERGWITSEWDVSENNRRAKFYKLTKVGRKQLEAQAANWDRVSQAITRIMQTA